MAKMIIINNCEECPKFMGRFACGRVWHSCPLPSAPIDVSVTTTPSEDYKIFNADEILEAAKSHAQRLGEMADNILRLNDTVNDLEKRLAELEKKNHHQDIGIVDQNLAVVRLEKRISKLERKRNGKPKQYSANRPRISA